ncbi:MAG: hypothetical protein MZW92_47810 [Comamonadaceae bacterium]|nr:hypothetical protein [Comamonadaceae bacterium]
MEAEVVEAAPAAPEAASPAAKIEPEPAAADTEAGVQAPPPVQAPATDIDESAPAGPPTAAEVSPETAAEAVPETTEDVAPAEISAPPTEAPPEPSPSEQSLPLREPVTEDSTHPLGAAEPVRSKPSWVARLRAALPRPKRRGKAKAAAAPAKRKASSRRGPGPLTWTGMLVLALAATAALLPGYLRPEIEAWASARIGQQVSVESVGLALEPTLGLRLEGVAVGTSAWRAPRGW